MIARPTLLSAFAFSEEDPSAAYKTGLISGMNRPLHAVRTDGLLTGVRLNEAIVH
jgi:hypothetical protein